MDKYTPVEHFAILNDCTTPCLISQLNPYQISQALFYAGKNYRSSYKVDTETINEMVQEEFKNKLKFTTENFTNDNNENP